jgi:hypothetical protein
MASNVNGSSSYVPIRIPNEVLAQISAIVAKSVTHRAKEPWTVSSWIKSAIMEKLAHSERGRASKKGKKTVNEMVGDMNIGELCDANN